MEYQIPTWIEFILTQQEEMETDVD